MRRRRHKLEVSTFPFLAVLLCAMGSLILMLLVLDRRAKAAARERAERAAQQIAAEEVHLAEQRRQEWEKKREALHAELVHQDQELRDRIGQVEQQIVAARDKLKSKEERRRQEQEQVRTQRTELASLEKEIQRRRAAASQAGEQSQDSEQELRQLTRELQILERTLEELKSLRQRQQQTYSIVPYRGRRGDNRTPLYLECAGSGLIFHPDKKVISSPGRSGDDVRKEVARRIASQKTMLAATGRKPDAVPYLLMLIRPDGITNYYQTMRNLQGLDFDFGYELIDADWVLDFPEDGQAIKPQPWMVVERPVTGKSPPPLPAVRPGTAGVLFGGPAKQGVGGGVGESQVAGATGGQVGIPGPSGSGTGPWRAAGNGTSPGPAVVPTGDRGAVFMPPGAAGNSVSMGVPTVAGNGSGNPAPQGATGSLPGTRPGGTDSATGPKGVILGGPSGGPGNLAVPGLEPGLPGKGGGQGARTASVAAATPANPSSALPGTGAPTGSVSRQGLSPLLPESARGSGGSGGTGIGSNNPSQANQTSAGGSGTGQGSPGGTPTPVLPGSPVSATPAAIARGPNAGQAQPGSNGESSEQVETTGDSSPSRRRPLQAPEDPFVRTRKPSRPLELRPALLGGGRDYIILLECKASAVVLYPSGNSFSAASLAPGNGGGAVLQEAISRLIARKQATVRKGEQPYRPQVRFLVRPDGLLSFHRAYPVLESLQVTLTRQNLDADEDIFAAD